MLPSIKLAFALDRLIPHKDLAAPFKAPEPTIVTWSRMEVQPYNEDLTHSLQAPVADPLWMLTRQWQFNEFRGEDAGTPIWSQLRGERGQLSGYSTPDGTQHRYVDSEQPLEVLVEQEMVRATHPRLSSDAGEHLLRLLAAQGIATARAHLRQAFALDISDDQLWAGDADSHGLQWQSLFHNRAIDGHRIRGVLKKSLEATDTVDELPIPFNTIDATKNDVVLEVCRRWLDWYRQHIREPENTQDNAWQPSRQEYRFGVTAQVAGTDIELQADEYTGGELDWYSFDVKEPKNNTGTTSDRTSSIPFAPRPVLPSPVRFSGMPADRLWEFEDARVNLGYLEAGPNDLGRLLLAEFALVYSNDWFVIPIDMPVGSVFAVDALKVRDTFGIEVDIKPARNFDGSRWSMFSLSGASDLSDETGSSDLFFLPPVLSERLTGDPSEEIQLFRDEMANMAWGVEKIVQGASGMPHDRHREVPTSAVQQRVDPVNIPTKLIYRLMSTVADNWLPFVPTTLSQQRPNANTATFLERRTLLRTQTNGQRTEIHPRGVLLRSDLAIPVENEPPLAIHEEEVPRDGARVKRCFQYSRWGDGGRSLWMGRQKSPGQSQDPSGLHFDVSVFTDEQAANTSNQSSMNTLTNTLKLQDILNTASSNVE